MADLLAAVPAAWTDGLPPTRSAASARIARVRPDAYARTRNHLGGAVTGLDEFNGHVHGVLPYHYHATATYPYINGGMRGVVEVRVDARASTHVVPPRRRGADDGRREQAGLNEVRFEVEREQAHLRSL